jgi:hypothetical protein
MTAPGPFLPIENLGEVDSYRIRKQNNALASTTKANEI